MAWGRTAGREELAVWGRFSRVNYRPLAQSDLSRKAGKMKKLAHDLAGFADQL
jgi:hypothetical protein